MRSIKRFGNWYKRKFMGVDTPSPADIGRGAKSVAGRAFKPIERDYDRERAMSEDFDFFLRSNFVSRGEVPRVKNVALLSAIIFFLASVVFVALAALSFSAGDIHGTVISLIFVGTTLIITTVHYYRYTILAREHYVPFTDWLTGEC